MNNYKSLVFIGFISLSMLLCACDQSTQHQKLVVNNSDYDLIILTGDSFSEYGSYVSDSIFIGRHSQATIFDMRQISRLKEYKSCNTFTDSLRAIVVDHDSLHVTLDLSNKSNWKYFTIRKEIGGGGECECQIGINNADIQ